MRKSKIALTIIAAVAFSALLFTSSCESKNTEQATDTTADTVMDTTTDTDMSMDDNGNSLTKFRKAMADLPLKDVITIFNGMTPELRAALWRNKLSDAMERGLNDEQKNVLGQMLENLSAESYTAEGSKKYMAFYRELEPGALKAFNNDSMKFFNIIGNLDKPVEMSETDEEKKDCDCNKGTDLCAINFKCKTKDCEESSWGCGVLGLQSCDGLCTYQP